MIDESLFHTRLKEAREAKKLTQKQLAEKIGLTTQTISSYERDKFPTVDGIIKLSRELGVSIDWLMGDDRPADNAETLADAFEHIEAIERITGTLFQADNRSHLWGDEVEEEYSIVLDSIPLGKAVLEQRKVLKGLKSLDPELKKQMYALWRNDILAKLKQIPAVKKDEEKDDAEENEQ